MSDDNTGNQRGEDKPQKTDVPPLPSNPLETKRQEAVAPLQSTLETLKAGQKKQESLAPLQAALASITGEHLGKQQKQEAQTAPTLPTIPKLSDFAQIVPNQQPGVAFETPHSRVVEHASIEDQQRKQRLGLPNRVAQATQPLAPHEVHGKEQQAGMQEQLFMVREIYRIVQDIQRNGVPIRLG
jgi:hypothetical protein